MYRKQLTTGFDCVLYHKYMNASIHVCWSGQMYLQSGLCREVLERLEQDAHIYNRELRNLTLVQRLWLNPDTLEMCGKITWVNTNGVKITRNEFLICRSNFPASNTTFKARDGNSIPLKAQELEESFRCPGLVAIHCPMQDPRECYGRQLQQRYKQKLRSIIMGLRCLAVTWGLSDNREPLFHHLSLKETRAVIPGGMGWW